MVWTERLLIPGPTHVPSEVLGAQARQMTNHRGASFSELVGAVEEEIALLADAERAVVLPSSGTGGLEAVAQNLLRPGDRVLAVSGGAFGERFARVAERSGAEVTRLEVTWGEAASPAEVVARAASGDFRAVLLTQNETSTGVLHPVEEIAWRLAGGPLVIVDAISGFPAVPLKLRKAGIDAAVACSQKGFMAPPGLSLVLLGPRGLDAASAPADRPAYFDLRPYLKGSLPYTPAVSLVYALRESLRLLEEEGEEARLGRHRLLAAMTRSAGKALGLAPLAPAAVASPAVTALEVPGGQADALRRAAQRRGAVLAGGQDRLKGRIVRVGHVGSVMPIDLLGGLGALELARAEVLGSAPDGRGVAAALGVWAVSWTTERSGA